MLCAAPEGYGRATQAGNDTLHSEACIGFGESSSGVRPRKARGMSELDNDVYLLSTRLPWVCLDMLQVADSSLLGSHLSVSEQVYPQEGDNIIPPPVLQLYWVKPSL